MSKSHASEKNAYGNCDRCGFRYKLRELRKETKNLNKQSLRVCPTCFDKDHPQNKLGRIDHSDNYGLRDPRPQQDLDTSRNGGGLFYDFEDGLEGWTSVLPATTVTHDSTNKLANVVFVEAGYVDLTLYSASIDASAYRSAICQFRVNTGFYPFPPSSSFTGVLNFKNATYPSGIQINTGKHILFETMGDRFVNFRFDFNSISTFYDFWTGTITEVGFEFFRRDDVSNDPFGNTGSLDVDWIKFEPTFT